MFLTVFYRKKKSYFSLKVQEKNALAAASRFRLSCVHQNSATVKLGEMFHELELHRKYVCTPMVIHQSSSPVHICHGCSQLTSRGLGCFMFTLLKWKYLLTHNKKQMGLKSLTYLLPYLKAETSSYHVFSFYTAWYLNTTNLFLFYAMHNI